MTKIVKNNSSTLDRVMSSDLSIDLPVTFGKEIERVALFFSLVVNGLPDMLYNQFIDDISAKMSENCFFFLMPSFI